MAARLARVQPGAQYNPIDLLQAQERTQDALTSLDGLYLRWVTAPAKSSSPGAVGSVAYDSGFLYVCVAANTWKRVALGTF